MRALLIRHWQLLVQRTTSRPDPWILLPVLALLSIGLIMVTSASLSFASDRFNNPLLFMRSHISYLLLGLVALVFGWSIDSRFWAARSRLWLAAGLLLILLIKLPGIGYSANGATRWLRVGGFTIQIAELVKLALIVYLAAWLERYRELFLRAQQVVWQPILVVALFAGLLVYQPDFGSAAVIVATAAALLFIGGLQLRWLLASAVLIGAGSYLLITGQAYRLARITAYLDPWADEYSTGYQLIQSLIAFGRGEWFGVGLGQSLQKMLYLPEAHTDFVFAIYAEEFGFVGVMVLVALFTLLIGRLLQLGYRALALSQWYLGFMLIGFAVMVAGQSFINLGVNAGLLPTKGLTLPFISFGGSSLVVCMAMAGLWLAAARELTSASGSGRVAKGRCATLRGSYV